ncbi:MAG: ATP-binding protein [Chitinophagales bacterium]|nr:ATP-binding protein [Chitinophagales bacterium]
MIIKRIQEQNLLAELTAVKSKVLILYGARQVGKTTLIHETLRGFQGKVLEINADNIPFMESLSSRNLDQLKGLVHGYDLLFVDEAQRIPDIGINLKILHDQVPGLKIIATGSSSLDLANRVKEPLTGRTWTFHLFPISAEEWASYYGANDYEVAQKLPEWLVYGLYPEVLGIENRVKKERYLQELTQSYLYRDILALANIRYPEKLRQILKLLAWQAGNLVSVNELANTLQINRDAVSNYIDLLEKSFVIFRLSGFSRNLRKEMVKMDKIYFYDLGVRNALIENYQPLTIRQDIGQLWENFLLAERLKTSTYHFHHTNRYFWRTQTGAELDYVEEYGGQLHGYEFKWGSTSARAPKTWIETYPEATFKCINSGNFMDFVRLGKAGG